MVQRRVDGTLPLTCPQSHARTIVGSGGRVIDGSAARVVAAAFARSQPGDTPDARFRNAFLGDTLGLRAQQLAQLGVASLMNSSVGSNCALVQDTSGFVFAVLLRDVEGGAELTANYRVRSGGSSGGIIEEDVDEVSLHHPWQNVTTP